jgi:hypothetical protein
MGGLLSDFYKTRWEFFKMTTDSLDAGKNSITWSSINISGTGNGNGE